MAARAQQEKQQEMHSMECQVQRIGWGGDFVEGLTPFVLTNGQLHAPTTLIEPRTDTSLPHDSAQHQTRCSACAAPCHNVYVVRKGAC